MANIAQHVSSVVDNIKMEMTGNARLLSSGVTKKGPKVNLAKANQSQGQFQNFSPKKNRSRNTNKKNVNPEQKLGSHDAKTGTGYRKPAQKRVVEISKHDTGNIMKFKTFKIDTYKTDLQNLCPFRRCNCEHDLKKHALREHVPSVFHEYNDMDVLDDDMLQEQRVTGLRILGELLIGPGSNSAALVTYYNSLIRGNKTKGGLMQPSKTSIKAMKILCRYTGWESKENFTITPVNHPAALIHWYPMMNLLAQLSDKQMAAFDADFHNPEFTVSNFQQEPNKQGSYLQTKQASVSNINPGERTNTSTKLKREQLPEPGSNKAHISDRTRTSGDKSRRPESDRGIKSWGSQFDPGVKSRGSQFDREDKSRGPQFDPEVKSRGRQFDPKVKSQGPQFDLGVKSRGSKFDQEVKSRKSQFDPGVKSRGSQLDPGVKSWGSQFDPIVKSRRHQYDPGVKSREPQFDSGDPIPMQNILNPDQFIIHHDDYDEFEEDTLPLPPPGLQQDTMTAVNIHSSLSEMPIMDYDNRTLVGGPAGIVPGQVGMPPGIGLETNVIPNSSYLPGLIRVGGPIQAPIYSTDLVRPGPMETGLTRIGGATQALPTYPINLNRPGHTEAGLTTIGVTQAPIFSTDVVRPGPMDTGLIRIGGVTQVPPPAFPVNLNRPGHIETGLTTIVGATHVPPSFAVNLNKPPPPLFSTDLVTPGPIGAGLTRIGGTTQAPPTFPTGPDRPRPIGTGLTRGGGVSQAPSTFPTGPDRPGPIGTGLTRGGGVNQVPPTFPTSPDRPGPIGTGLTRGGGVNQVPPTFPTSPDRPGPIGTGLTRGGGVNQVPPTFPTSPDRPGLIGTGLTRGGAPTQAVPLLSLNPRRPGSFGAGLTPSRGGMVQASPTLPKDPIGSQYSQRLEREKRPTLTDRYDNEVIIIDDDDLQGSTDGGYQNSGQYKTGTSRKRPYPYASDFDHQSSKYKSQSVRKRHEPSSTHQHRAKDDNSRWRNRGSNYDWKSGRGGGQGRSENMTKWSEGADFKQSKAQTSVSNQSRTFAEARSSKSKIESMNVSSMADKEEEGWKATAREYLKQTSEIVSSAMSSSLPRALEPSANDNIAISQGYDAYFHLDKVAKWMTREGIYLPTKEVEDIIGYKHDPEPQLPVELVGGVIVFNDPETFKDIQFPLNSKWKVAIGVDPVKVHTLNPDRLALFRSMSFNPLIGAIGGVGLDGTMKNLKKQEEVLDQILGLCTVNRPLLLHIREKKNESNNRYPMYQRCLEIVKIKCSPKQRIFIHCYMADTKMMLEWTAQFPNCMFGYCGHVFKLDMQQRLALQSAPLSKILLETSSPYFSVSKRQLFNTPAHLGDVAHRVASIKNIPPAVLLEETTKNARSFFSGHL